MRLKLEEFLRALFVGMALPALFLPILYMILFVIKPLDIENDNLHLVSLFIPLCFGLANVLYVFLKHKFPIFRHDYLLLIVGVILGLSLWLIKMPTFIFVAFPRIEDTEVFMLPIYYAFIFRFIMKPFNSMFGIK